MTSSASASGRSNGNRLVSARADTKKRRKPKVRGNTNQRDACWVRITSAKVTFPARITTAMTLMPSATS